MFKRMGIAEQIMKVQLNPKTITEYNAKNACNRSKKRADNAFSTINPDKGHAGNIKTNNAERPSGESQDYCMMYVKLHLSQNCKLPGNFGKIASLVAKIIMP